MTMFRKLFTAAALMLAATVAQAGTLYVTEFSGSPPTYVAYQAARVPALAQQTVNIGGVQAQSNPFTSTTGLVRIHCDVICNVNFGVNPGVTTGMMRLIAGQTEYFVVNPGDKVAVIAGT
jgi:hypothetical protein